MTDEFKSIAKAVGLPMTGIVNETCVMIDGKLKEMGLDPRNVQVTVVRDPCGWKMLSEERERRVY